MDLSSLPYAASTISSHLLTYKRIWMEDIDAFFAEQEQRMSLPDEDVDEYIRARLEELRKKRCATAFHSLQCVFSLAHRHILCRTMDSNHVIDNAIRTQDYGPDDMRKADASWHSSDLFHTSATDSVTSKRLIPEEEPLMQRVFFTFSCSSCKLKDHPLHSLKRKSAAHDPSAKEKKPRLDDTSRSSVLSPPFSRSDTEHAPEYVVLPLIWFSNLVCMSLN